MIRIGLLDDHKIVTEGLSMLISQEDDMEVVNTAVTGEQFLAQLTDDEPDVVVIDYSLSSLNRQQLNGYDTAKRILFVHPKVRILMLTMHNSEEIIVPCVELGIHGYMLKSERDFDVVAAIRRLLETGCYFSPEIAPMLAHSIKNFQSSEVELTTRELEVLDVLFRGNSAKEMGDILHISAKTVETHKKNLIAKFNAKNSIHLIYLALEKGHLNIKGKL